MLDSVSLPLSPHSASMSVRRNSIVVVSTGGWFVPAAPEPAPSLLRFATLQCVEGEQDLAGLAPKDGFIAAEPVERVVWLIGKAQEATRKVGGRIERSRP